MLSTPSATTPSLQQTSFTFPTPPPSSSSSPQPLLSSSSSSPSANTYHAMTETITPQTPVDDTFPDVVATCQQGLPNQMPAHSLLNQPAQPLQVDPVTAGNSEPSDPNSVPFIYPNIPPANPAPLTAQPLSNQSQAGAGLPCSRSSLGGPTSFPFASVPPHMQSLSFPNVSTSAAHPALHLPNLSHQAQTAPTLTSAFPPSSFAHPSFQPSSCLAVPSSFQQSAPPLPQAAQYPQTLPNVSTSSSSASSYPPVDVGGIPQFNPAAASYRPEMVLHHPSLLPQLDPSSAIPSSTPPQALYPAFPSYPLRLCQEPHSSLSIPFRHLYRQHQHGHAHPQGSYLDVSTRAVF